MIDRVKKIIEYKQCSTNSFAEMIGVKQNTLNQQLTGDRKLSLDVVRKIISTCNDISAEWLLTGDGKMLKNISENSENLSKQSISEERNNSIDELINQKIEKTVMENIPAIISAVMEGMNKQMEGQNQVINKQLDMLQEVIRSLADLNNKSDKIQDNILKLSRKAQ